MMREVPTASICSPCFEPQESGLKVRDRDVVVARRPYVVTAENLGDPIFSAETAEIVPQRRFRVAVYVLCANYIYGPPTVDR